MLQQEADDFVKTTIQNIQIRDLPIRVIKQLNSIAQLKGLRKWEVIRDALIEYVDRHSDEAVRAFRSSNL